MKAYIVKTSCGTYDDWIEVLVGIFSTPDKADEAKRKFHAQIIEYKNRYNDDAYQSKYNEWANDEDRKIDEDMPDYLQKWWDWKYSKEREMSENIIVNEIEADKIIYEL